MDLYGYCPRCSSNTLDMYDKTLCRRCEESAETGDELNRKVNALLNRLAIDGKDSTLVEALQAEIQRLRRTD